MPDIGTMHQLNPEPPHIGTMHQLGPEPLHTGEIITPQAQAEEYAREAQESADNAALSAAAAQSAAETAQQAAESIAPALDTKAPVVCNTASGAIASFTDGADDMPLRECVVQIEPVQSGSGDPSPTNVRPITGWTGANVSHSGADTTDPTVYHITFPSEAGTVYGGTLDVVNGTLTVDRAMVDLGTLTWGLRSSGLYRSTEIPNIKTVAAQSTKVNGIAEKYIVDSYTKARDNLSAFYLGMDSNKKQLFVSGGSPGSGSFVYELAEPIVYDLTALEVLETLKGVNNIWADTGNSSVTYPADTKLYIQQLTKPTEDDLVANAAITSGQFFMIGNRLFIATASIANGAMITPGTNATELSLADALNSLNS